MTKPSINALQITKKPSRNDLLKIVTLLQTMISNGRSLHANDLNPHGFEQGQKVLQDAFELCIKARSFDPPTDIIRKKQRGYEQILGPKSYQELADEISEIRAENARLSEIVNRDPFGYWHRGDTLDESEFHLASVSGDVSCEHCVKLFEHEERK